MDSADLPVGTSPEEEQSRRTSGPAPLKRGTACRRCRSRKIDGRECVFDEVKVKGGSSSAKGKINALETKIADLEKILTRQFAPQPATAAPMPALPSYPSFGQPPATLAPYPLTDVAQQLSHFELSDAIPGPFDPAPYTIRNAIPVAPVAPSTFAGPSRNGPSSSSSFPYPPRAPRSKAVLEEARREADQRAFMLEIERLFGTAEGAGFAVQPAPDLTSQLGWETMPSPTGHDSAPAFGGNFDFGAAMASSGLDVGGYFAVEGLAPTADTDFSMFINSPSPAAGPSSSAQTGLALDGSAAFELRLQEWVDSGKIPELLPALVRDELVDTSLRWRRQVALILSPEDLLASIDGPEDKRPHPGLLWAMFTHGARYHPSRLVRSLQEDLYRVAKVKLDEGMSRHDRVIDVIRGTALLTSWLFMNGRFHEGFLLSGCASRLAMAAMLHRMSWPFFRSEDSLPQARWLSLSKRPTQILPPPDSWTTALDRLYAFWQVVTMDRIASISTHLPPCIPDEEIETPFCPCLAVAHNPAAADQVVPSTVADLFSDDDGPTLRETSEDKPIGAAIFKALLLLSRVSRLSDLFVQPSRTKAYLAEPATTMPALDMASPVGLSPDEVDLSCVGSLSPDGPPQHQEATMPPEMSKLEHALDRYVASLPPHFCDATTFPAGFEDDGRTVFPRHGFVRSMLFLLQSEIRLCQALLAEEQSRFDHATYWPKCVAAARSVVQLIRTIADVDFARLDILMGLCWREVSRMLIAEARIQREAGNEALASNIETEIEVLVLSMKRLSTILDFETQ